MCASGRFINNLNSLFMTTPTPSKPHSMTRDRTIMHGAMMKIGLMVSNPFWGTLLYFTIPTASVSEPLFFAHLRCVAFVSQSAIHHLLKSTHYWIFHFSIHRYFYLHPACTFNRIIISKMCSTIPFYVIGNLSLFISNPRRETGRSSWFQCLCTDTHRKTESFLKPQLHSTPHRYQYPSCPVLYVCNLH